jgi:uncharacterized protein YecE (DUF72 family)
VYIGTSGWTYSHWEGRFYPEGLSKKKWLSYYMGQFCTVELNATFYRSIKGETFARWYGLSPAGFVWSVKMSRFITHIKRLQNCEEALERFIATLIPLKEKLGCILVQLPPSLAFHEDEIVRFRHLIPSGLKVAIEARNRKWLAPEVMETLRGLGIAWCISDTAGRYPYAEEVTADFVYIRLHGSQSLYKSLYTEEELSSWAQKIKGWGRTTYVYFDNDYMAYAPRNAARLKELMKERKEEGKERW